MRAAMRRPRFARYFCTVTKAEAPVFPAASRAIACRVCDPDATCDVFHLKLNGAEVSVAVSTPSTYSATETTPTLSLELVVIVTFPESVEPEAGDVMDTVGGVTSVLLLTFTVTLAVLDAPAASRAVALTEWVPLLKFPLFQAQL